MTGDAERNRLIGGGGGDAPEFGAELTARLELDDAKGRATHVQRLHDRVSHDTVALRRSQFPSRRDIENIVGPGASPIVS